MMTAWSTRPTFWRAPAMSSRSSGWKTPMTARWAPAAFVMGPRMLKQVRTPSFFRTGATNRIAGWLTGAIIKATPTWLTHSTTCSGERSMVTPRASRTSADPQALLTDRFPALATVQPLAAANTTDAVEMLMVSAPSPPVPTISRSFWPLRSTELQASFIAWTMPAISSGVSPFCRKRVRSEPTWTSSAPLRISEKADLVSSVVRERSPAISVSM
mmetsp:Transcript_23464/g.49938  ORF Transcript_23464/g.49938 Transcript_23464/m.49938 type:complete len:215 (+) Transcript_23464:564-1208(+)